MKSAATDAKEKLTGKKLLDLPPTLLGRLNKHAASKRHGNASEIARRAIEVECDRLDALNVIEQQRLEKLTAIAAAQGGDVDAVIDRMLLAVKEPELALPVGGVR
jgi:hypothetical protein